VNRFLLFTLLFVLASFLGCRKSVPPVRSMYYWKTVFQPTEWETDFIKNNHIGRLYVKYLDIGWDEEGHRPLVLSATTFPPLRQGGDVYRVIHQSKNWVPVVFITNAVFLHTDTIKVREMARQVYNRLGSMLHTQDELNPWQNIAEVQFDCDWNKSSRAAYFAFLQAFRAAAGAGCALSATVRLHQYRYPEATGVPPADRCMLMLYNMNDPARPGDKNTIFDAETARSYISRAGTYPLKLDIALPAFTWVLCYRKAKLAQIVIPGNLPMKDTGVFFQQDKRRYILRIDTVLGKTYHRSGDIFMYEEISAEIIEDGSKIAADIQLHPQHVAFYSLNEALLKKYEKSVFDQAFDRHY
jgi:uncharacterized protein involved in tolerance to divalent cations